MSSTFSMQSIASPGAKIGELTTGTAVFTKYSRELCASERTYMIKNNQLAALKKYQVKSIIWTHRNRGWYMDYDNEPNSQNVGIWSQLNGLLELGARGA